MTSLQTLNRILSKPPVDGAWLPASQLRGDCPAVLRDWLLDQGSLTARLQRLGDGQLQVRILSQYWGRGDSSEHRVLGLAPRDRVMIREVLLRGRGKNWVFARSIMPHSSLTGVLRCLRRLNDRPLGSWLFRQPGLRRGPLQLSTFAPGDRRLCAMEQDLPANTARLTLIGRRSVFYVNEKPLLVAEVFLPDLAIELAGCSL